MSYVNVDTLSAADVKVGQKWFAPPDSSGHRAVWVIAQIDYATMTCSMVNEHDRVESEVGTILAMWSPAWKA